MELKKNKVKKKLAQGGTCFGTMIRVMKSPQTVSLCAAQGWDYIIFDTEHNDYNIETLSNMALVAKYEEMAMFVRVPDKHYHLMATMLDVGAEGLVLPQVKTKAEAEHIVRSTKFAPAGNKGVSLSETNMRFRTFPMPEYMQWSNDETMNIIQIESMEGVANVEEIVSTIGVDAVMIGPADLTTDMGIPGQIDHPEVEASFVKIIAACNQHGVAPGIHLTDMSLVERWVKRGMRFITYSYDIALFKDASSLALKTLRQI